MLSIVEAGASRLATYIEILGRPEPRGQGLSKPSVKQHLAGLRMLFDRLVVGQILVFVHRI